MFMLASSPIEKTAIHADISGKFSGNLSQAPEQGKRFPTPWLSRTGLFRAAVQAMSGTGW